MKMARAAEREARTPDTPAVVLPYKPAARRVSMPSGDCRIPKMSKTAKVGRSKAS